MNESLTHAPTAFLARFHKIQVPSMQPRNIGISTRRKGSENIQSLGTLMIGFDHVIGIMSAGFGGEVFPVDIVPTVRREGDAISHLIGFRPRLGKLARHASHLDDGHRGPKGQNQRHLEENTKGIADVIDIEFVKGFRAIPTHQQKALSAAGAGQLFVKCSDFSSKDQGRASLEFFDGLFEFLLVLVFRRLRNRPVFPRGGCPCFVVAGFCGDTKRRRFSRTTINGQ